MQGMQGYSGQVFVNPDGIGAAGPELFARLLYQQQRPGHQVYMSPAPQGMPITLTMSPERGTPERQLPASPGTVMFSSPSMTNYQRFQSSDGPDEEGVRWWTSMKYHDQQIVRTQFAAGELTSYPGVRQSGQYLLCQERDDGPIHLFDNQMWSVKDAYT